MSWRSTSSSFAPMRTLSTGPGADRWPAPDAPAAASESSLARAAPAPFAPAVSLRTTSGSSSAPIDASARIAARSTEFLSSRTLPGQE